LQEALTNIEFRCEDVRSAAATVLAPVLIGPTRNALQPA